MATYLMTKPKTSAIIWKVWLAPPWDEPKLNEE